MLSAALLGALSGWAIAREDEPMKLKDPFVRPSSDDLGLLDPYSPPVVREQHRPMKLKNPFEDPPVEDGLLDPFGARRLRGQPARTPAPDLKDPFADIAPPAPAAVRIVVRHPPGVRVIVVNESDDRIEQVEVEVLSTP